MNSINVIAPYKHHGLWVFDDPKVGLVEEPFVGGADTMIDRVTAGIPDPEAGFVLVFAAIPFPGHQFALDWQRADGSGNIYHSAQLELAGWLCPALLRYFDGPPERLYVQVKPRA